MALSVGAGALNDEGKNGVFLWMLKALVCKALLR
jgi:hypothetical protein